MKYNNGNRTKTIIQGDSIIGSTPVQINLKIEYDYDKNDNLVRRITKNDDGSTNDIYKYDYNEKGDKILDMFENKSSGESVYKTTIDYQYDKAGNIVEAVYKTRKNYKYDKEGNAVAEDSTDYKCKLYNYKKLK